MTDNNNIQAQQQIPKPDPALKRLDVLVCTWNIKGCESGSMERYMERLPSSGWKAAAFSLFNTLIL
jgi:hypothetical protein